MAITVICDCGNVMAAADEHAGRRVRCSSCKRAVVVPGGDGEDEPVTSAPPKEAAVSAGDRPRRVVPPTRVRVVEIDLSYFNLAAFLVKLVAASFPAAVVAYLLYGLVYALLSGR